MFCAKSTSKKRGVGIEILLLKVLFSHCDPKSYPELLIAQIIQGQGTENYNNWFDMMSSDQSDDWKSGRNFNNTQLIDSCDMTHRFGVLKAQLFILRIPFYYWYIVKYSCMELHTNCCNDLSNK